MNLDLYTLTAFFVGILGGAVAGTWLARFITGLTVERLERKVQSVSDNKFDLKGQRVRLKQLEQRLDAEAARIPLAERELKEKSVEIRELTTALNETTALTSELTAALRARKAKVQQLQLEQTKWLKRNKALLLKSESTEQQIAELKKEIAKNRSANGVNPDATHDANHTAANGTTNGAAAAQSPAQGATELAAAGRKKEAPTAAPAMAQALAAGHHLRQPAITSTTTFSSAVDKVAGSNVESLVSRMQQMESELEAWFERVGKLEANVTSQVGQASSLALLEQVLRGEAKAQENAKSPEMPTLLGSKSAS